MSQLKRRFVTTVSAFTVQLCSRQEVVVLRRAYMVLSLTHSLEFLFKRWLRIFEDRRNHINRGMDGDVYCQKTGMEKRRWNKNLEKDREGRILE